MTPPPVKDVQSVMLDIEDICKIYSGMEGGRQFSTTRTDQIHCSDILKCNQIKTTCKVVILYTFLQNKMGN